MLVLILKFYGRGNVTSSLINSRIKRDYADNNFRVSLRWINIFFLSQFFIVLHSCDERNISN
jgi:hypothetical protein